MNEKIFIEHYQTYYDRVYRAGYAWLRNPHEAEEVAQETFLKLWKREEKFQTMQHMEAWLITVACNQAKNILWRFDHREVENFSEEFDGAIQSDVYKMYFWESMMALREEERTALYFYYFEGYKIKEIAKMMDMNENTIKTHLQRGRKALRLELGGQDETF